MDKVKAWLNRIRQNKKWAAAGGISFILAVSILFSGGDQKEYITELVEEGPLSQIVSVTGSVEADNAVELRFGTNGTVGSILVEQGQTVQEGDVLVSLQTDKLQSEVDRAAAGVQAEQAELNLMLAGPSDEEISVSNAKIHEAEINATNAQQTYENALLSNAENYRQAELELENAQIDLDNAQVAYNNEVADQVNSTTQSDADLSSAYEDAIPAVESSFGTIKQAKDTVDLLLGEEGDLLNTEFDTEFADASLSDRNALKNSFNDVTQDLESLEAEFDSLQSSWSGDEVDGFMESMVDMMETAKTMVDLAYDILNIMESDTTSVQADIDTLKSDMELEQSTVTASLAEIQNALQTIESAQLDGTSSGLDANTSLSDADAALEQAANQLEIAESNLTSIEVQNTIDENEAAMNVDLREVQLEQRVAEHAKLVAVPREVDLAAQRARLAQAQASYQGALSDFEDGLIRAPGEGIVAKIDVSKGQTLSTSETAVQFITTEFKVTANISETDITKVGLNNPVTMTLDALPLDQKFEGRVSSLDPAETVIQGVVYYEANIIMDTQDERIRPGMTVNIDVLTDEKENTLQISPQALQFEEDQTFVFVLVRGESVKRLVTTGLQGEKKIEILSGLEKGEELILYEK